MQYETLESSLTVKHLWQNQKVSVYADENKKTGTFEVELAINYKEKDGEYFRLGNVLSEREALEKVVNVLEIFDG